MRVVMRSSFDRWMLNRMTAADDAPERSHQGIDEWARHGVQEYEEREAVERAELGEESEPDRVR
jgi:hypothetical protein